jgi:hypothetical protein
MSKKIQYIPSRLFHLHLIYEKCCSQIASLLFSKNVDLHLISISFPCQCELWGFNDGKTKWGNPYCVIHVDMLHQFDLGVFKTLVDTIWNILFTNFSKVLLELNKYLFETKARSCFPRCYVPNVNKKGYFSPNEKFATFEHRMYGHLFVFNEHLNLLTSYESWGG